MDSQRDQEEDLSDDGGDSHSSNTKKKKSFTQDVKDKLSFLRRRHTDNTITNEGAKKPTPEAILSWSESFDNLMADKAGVDMFREFLRTEFSEENLEFWLACEEFKAIKARSVVPQAQRIYTDFVAIQAAREINLDSKTRELTSENMSNPNKDTFDVAQKRIQALMEKDSYPRFLRSNAYNELIKDHKHAT